MFPFYVIGVIATLWQIGMPLFLCHKPLQIIGRLPQLNTPLGENDYKQEAGAFARAAAEAPFLRPKMDVLPLVTVHEFLAKGAQRMKRQKIKEIVSKINKHDFATIAALLRSADDGEPLQLPDDNALAYLNGSVLADDIADKAEYDDFYAAMVGPEMTVLD